MKDWFKLLFQHPNTMAYGTLLNYFSSFGQTFFISLFVPWWIEHAGVSNAEFGQIYGIISILSALMLPIPGRWIDRISLRSYSIAIYVGLAASTLWLAGADSPIKLFIGLFLVRMFGQGLMTHTSSTAIAKIFTENRGKALSLTSMGHPLAQLTLPLILAALLIHFSHPVSLMVLVIASAVILTPILLQLKADPPVSANEKNNAETSKNNKLLRQKTFWLLASNIFVIPFLATAIMLYQFAIAEAKGWDSSWVTFSFAFFAAFNGLSIFASGELIDRFGSTKLFAAYLLPAMIGFILLGISNNPLSFPIFYGLLGISAGTGMTVKTAIQADIYGTRQLGKVRSLLSTVMVLGTAAGPPLFGGLLDLGMPLHTILIGSAAMLLIVAYTGTRAVKTAESELI